LRKAALNGNYQRLNGLALAILLVGFRQSPALWPGRLKQAKKFTQPQKAAQQPCKHPRVQIVSRDEDAEFVECLECREVFESSELKDMSIEERTESEAEEL